MNADYPVDIDLNRYPRPFHVWESAIWLKATQREIICTPTGEYRLVKEGKSNKGDRIVANELRRCNLDEIRDDGRFQFSYTDKSSNKEIYYRPDLDENEKAFQQVIPFGGNLKSKSVLKIIIIITTSIKDGSIGEWE